MNAPIFTDDTDQRQGVTPIQHKVFDLLDARTPMWLMQGVDELVQRQDREACSENPDFILLAALALHLAERTAATASSKPGSVLMLKEGEEAPVAHHPI